MQSVHWTSTGVRHCEYIMTCRGKDKKKIWGEREFFVKCLDCSRKNALIIHEQNSKEIHADTTRPLML